MRTPEWNALNHVVDALMHLSSIEYLDANLYESTFEVFKVKYRKSFKKGETADTEVLI